MSSRLDFITDWDSRVARAHFRAKELQKELKCSESTLRRFCIEKFGKPTVAVLDESRLAGAIRMLLAGEDEKAY